jgi:hypothetical protein
MNKQLIFAAGIIIGGALGYIYGKMGKVTVKVKVTDTGKTMEPEVTEKTDIEPEPEVNEETDVGREGDTINPFYPGAAHPFVDPAEDSTQPEQGDYVPTGIIDEHQPPTSEFLGGNSDEPPIIIGVHEGNISVATVATANGKSGIQYPSDQSQEGLVP